MTNTRVAEILYVEYGSTQPWYRCNPNTEFTRAMEEVADGYVRTGSIADFVVIDSDVISDIIFSNQCFYEREMVEALEKRNVRNVEVQGRMGSTCYGSLMERMKEELGDKVQDLWEMVHVLSAYGGGYGQMYPDSDGDFVLYKINRK